MHACIWSAQWHASSLHTKQYLYWYFSFLFFSSCDRLYDYSIFNFPIRIYAPAVEPLCLVENIA